MDYVHHLRSLPQYLVTPLARSIAKEKLNQHDFYCNEFLSAFRQGLMRNHEDALQLVTTHMQGAAMC
jgi:hypothetical protein